MERGRRTLSPHEAAITAMFTALVCIATISFTIYVPQTKGFFNIGEAMVYITALLFGPLIGAVSGGAGSMLADLILGYSHYAPATLIIKGFEGGIVGLLTRKRPKIASEREWKIVTSIMGVFLGAALGIIGATYYSGSVELYLGLSTEQSTAILNVPFYVWYILGGLAASAIILSGLLVEPELGWTVISIILGGSIMVTGYFLYEQFLLGVLAYAEVPVNIGQMTIGLIVSIPVVRGIYRYLPSLRGRY